MRQYASGSDSGLDTEQEVGESISESVAFETDVADSKSDFDLDTEWELYITWHDLPLSPTPVQIYRY